MKRFVLAVAVLAMAYGMSSPARADFAVAKFADGYCRVWVDTAQAPWAGRFLWWRGHWGHHHWHHHHWYYRFATLAGAERHLHRAVWWHRCHHWW